MSGIDWNHLQMILGLRVEKYLIYTKVHLIRSFVYEIDEGSYLCSTAVKIMNRYVRIMAKVMGLTAHL